MHAICDALRKPGLNVENCFKMIRNASGRDFDIDCLRHIVSDPEARAAALSAAMIKVHALDIARTVPERRDEALEIVRHCQRLYAGLPRRALLRRIVEDHLKSSPRRSLDEHVDILSEALWRHFRGEKS